MPLTDKEATVLIHGSSWQRAHVEEAVADCLGRAWTRQPWFPRDALVHRNGSATSLYIGQKYDPAKIDLVPGGWNHDHCAICFWDLFQTDDAEHGVGYTDGHDWLCAECYERFVVPPERRSN
jgi:hypothetical protein